MMVDEVNKRESDCLLSIRGKKLLENKNEINKNPVIGTNNEKRKSRIQKEGKKFSIPRSKSLYGYKSELIKNKIIEAKESFYLNPSTLTHYPLSPTGIESIKISCSNFISNHLSCNISPNNLIIAPGTAASLDMLAFALFDPYDCILCPAPYYKKYYEIFTTKHSINLIPIHFEDINTPKLSRNLFESPYLRCKKVKGVLISNPHNPTGSVFSLDQVREVILFCEEKGITLIMDEANAFTVYDKDGKKEFGSILKELEKSNKYKNIFWTWSFSKDMLLPGLGFSLVYMEDGKTYECMEKLSNYNAVNGLTQNFAEEFLHDGEWFDEVQKTKNEELTSNREMVMLKLRELKVPFVKPLGGFLIYFNLSHLDQGILLKFLENDIYFEHIGGEDFDGYEKGWFAISLSQKREDLYGVMEKMGRIIKEFCERRTLQSQRSISYAMADDVMKEVLQFLDHPKESDREIVRKISQSSKDHLSPDEENGKYINKNQKDSIDHIVNECNLSKIEKPTNPHTLIPSNEEKRILLDVNAESQQKDEILLQSPATNQENTTKICEDSKTRTLLDCDGETVDGESSKAEIFHSHTPNSDGIEGSSRCTKVMCPICENERKKEKVDDKVIKTGNPIDLEEVFQIKLGERINNVKNDWIVDMVRRHSQRRSKSHEVIGRGITKIEEEESNREIDYYEEVPEKISPTMSSSNNSSNNKNDNGIIDYRQLSNNNTKVQLDDNNKVSSENDSKIDDNVVENEKVIVGRQVLDDRKVGEKKVLQNKIPLEVIFSDRESENFVNYDVSSDDRVINLGERKNVTKEQVGGENVKGYSLENGLLTGNKNKGTVIRKEDNFMTLDSDTLTIDSISDIKIEDGDIIIVEEKKTIIEGGDSDKNSVLLDYIFNNDNNNKGISNDGNIFENKLPSNGRKVIECEKSNSYTVRSIDNTKPQMNGTKSKIDLNQIFLNDGDQKEFKDKVFDNMYVLTREGNYQENVNVPSTATITFRKTETNVEAPFDHREEKNKLHTQLIEPTMVSYLSTEELNVNEDGTKIYTESSYDTEINLMKEENFDRASIHFLENDSDKLYISLENNKINDEVYMGIMKEKSVQLGSDKFSNVKEELVLTPTSDGETNTSFSYIKIPDTKTRLVIKNDGKSLPQKDNKTKSFTPIDLSIIFNRKKSTSENIEVDNKDTTTKNDSCCEENETTFEGSFSSSNGGRRYLTHEYRKVSSYHVPHSGVEKKIQKKNTSTESYSVVDDGKSCDSGFTGDKIDNEVEVKVNDNDKDEWYDDVKRRDVRRCISLKDDSGRRSSNESDNSNDNKSKEWIQDWERTNSFKDVNKKESRERLTSFTEVTVDLSDIIGISIKNNGSELGDSAYLSMSPEMRKKDKRDSGYCRDSSLSSDTRKSYTPKRLSYTYDISSDGMITTPNDAINFLRDCKKDKKYDGVIPNQWNLTNEVIENDSVNKQKFIEYSVTKNEYNLIPPTVNYQPTNDIILDVRLIQRQHGSAVGYYYPPLKDSKSYITELHLVPKRDVNFYPTGIHIPREEMYLTNEGDNKREIDFIHPETNTKHFIIKSFQPSPVRTRKVVAKPLKFESNYNNGKEGIMITYEIFKKNDGGGDCSVVSISDRSNVVSVRSGNGKGVSNEYGLINGEKAKKTWYVTSVKKTPRPAFCVSGSLTIDINLKEK
uniref:Aminotran_1_2 domain-containing protein n=1 Tax=Strongyloides venezuelensis TaxID=75913 RepID=A0A0K0FD91_STRVS